MARSSRKLAIRYSPESLVDLDEIWEWNANQRGVVYANSYIASLKSATHKLTQISNPGMPVPKSSIYRCAILKRRRKGYGHVVAFTNVGVSRVTPLVIWQEF